MLALLLYNEFKSLNRFPPTTNFPEKMTDAKRDRTLVIGGSAQISRTVHVHPGMMDDQTAYGVFPEMRW